MLSLFPELLFLAPLAAFLIRVTVGILLAYAAFRHLSDSLLMMRIVGGVQAILATLLILGTYTQAAALIALIFALISLTTSKHRVYPRSTLALAAIMAFTLLITGAGPFAFDLPL